MPRSPAFKPCSACLKPMPMGDPHDSLKCLVESHQSDKCRICKAFKPRTKKERDFRLKQLLMEAALSPVPSALHAQTRRRWSEARLRHQNDPAPAPAPPPAPVQMRHRSLSLRPKKQHKPPAAPVQLQAPPVPLLEQQPGPDCPVKAPTPAPSIPALQEPLSPVHTSSPVCTVAELGLPSTPEAFSTTCNLIALTEPGPSHPPAPPVRTVPSIGKPAFMRPNFQVILF
ncbi:pistil-specific extensin-like protein [Mauremys reevesii]|uniref:pistil-specific extensin-like protein n=1 Tax=Mauremys reevesii TaxID=260615 RepID=UPI00193F48B1|nr:pistil-specific extensin-like protein [Mauremys reevesii]